MCVGLHSRDKINYLMQTIEIKVPDVGDFDKVPVIEIFVKVGDSVAKEDPLIALESDKATMEVPSSDQGKVREINVAVGDEVSEGTVIMVLESADGEETSGQDGGDNAKPDAGDDAGDDDDDDDKSADTGDGETTATPESSDDGPADPGQDNDPGELEIGDGDEQADLVVLGSGPGGYTAAFRAADLGLSVILVERYATIGGVCLNVGCIPSKALLHAARVIEEAAEAHDIGISFSKPKVDIDKTRSWKDGIVKQLTSGLQGLAKQRKVKVITGAGKFSGSHQITVTTDDGKTTIGFKQAVIAAGSEAVKIADFPHDDERILDSTSALELQDIPKKLLIVGGGIIGLEMATVYHALGSEITVVEMLDNIMTGADPDMVKPLLKRLQKQYANIWTATRVTGMKAGKKGIEVSFDGKDAPDSEVFDKVLVSVGRSPNGGKIDADKAGVRVSERGFIEVDDQMRTNVPHIFAIGDIVGQPMLAHKAVHEGKVAAEVAAGEKSGFDARVIPSVAYTDPEVAWVGITETEAREREIDYYKGAFPWAASGRALTQGRSEGISKLLFDSETDRLIGAAVTGQNAGDLIAEATLAIEMNADAEDIGLTIHAHPTLSETIGFAAEIAEGTITDLYMPKKKKSA